MISFSVRAEVEQVRRALNEAQQKVVPMAVQAALNSAVKSAHTAAVREVSSELRAKQKYVRTKLRFQRRDMASRWNWEAGVFTVLSDFAASAFGKPRQLKKGAKAGQYSFPGAFVATMPKGTPEVYRRKTKKRFPIKVERIPVREQIERITVGAIERVGMPAFLKRFDHEMEYRLRRAGL